MCESIDLFEASTRHWQEWLGRLIELYFCQTWYEIRSHIPTWLCKSKFTLRMVVNLTTPSDRGHVWSLYAKTFEISITLWKHYWCKWLFCGTTQETLPQLNIIHKSLYIVLCTWSLIQHSRNAFFTTIIWLKTNTSSGISLYWVNCCWYSP